VSVPVHIPTTGPAETRKDLNTAIHS